MLFLDDVFIKLGQVSIPKTSALKKVAAQDFIPI